MRIAAEQEGNAGVVRAPPRPVGDRLRDGRRGPRRQDRPRRRPAVQARQGHRRRRRWQGPRRRRRRSGSRRCRRARSSWPSWPGRSTPPPTQVAGLLAANLRNLGYAAGPAPRAEGAAPARSATRRPTRPPARRAHPKEHHPMATLTQDQILDAIGAMTLVEVSEFIKKFEEKFGVTAAAPVAVAAAAPAAGAAAAGRGRGGADRVHAPSSPRSAPTRSRSSRSSASSPASASRRPRTSSTRPPSRSRRASPRTRPRRSRPPSRSRAPRSRSSSDAAIDPSSAAGRPLGAPGRRRGSSEPGGDLRHRPGHRHV